MQANKTQVHTERRATRTPVSGADRPKVDRPVQRTDLLQRVGTKDLARLASQLSTLLHAGMPLVPALSALAEQLQEPTGNKKARWARSASPLAKIVEQIRDDVNAGSRLADALGQHPNVFSPLFINMVAAGETSGALEAVLARLAEILNKRMQLAGKVKAAVAYPVMMMFVAAGVVMFLVSFVVPSITELFVKMNQELPWPTKFLIAISGFAKAHGLIVLVALCAAIIGGVAFAKSQDGRIRVDRAKLSLPLFGPLFFKLEVARLTRTLGTLLKSGIPIIAAMDISRRVAQNSVIADAADAIKELIHKGESIANAVKATGLFPPVVFHVLATGQMSGNIEEGLLNIAEMYDGEIESSVRTLTALLEPMILLVMGGVVGFIVLAILLPIFEINQAL